MASQSIYLARHKRTLLCILAKNLCGLCAFFHHLSQKRSTGEWSVMHLLQDFLISHMLPKLQSKLFIFEIIFANLSSYQSAYIEHVINTQIIKEMLGKYFDVLILNHYGQ